MPKLVYQIIYTVQYYHGYIEKNWMEKAHQTMRTKYSF